MTATTAAPLKREYYNKNKAYFQAYYQKHRETLLEYARANHKRTYATQKDKKIQRAKDHHAQNRDKKLAQMKAYYLKTKQKRMAATAPTINRDTCCRTCCPHTLEPSKTTQDGAVTAAASAILHMRQSPMMAMQFLLNPIDDAREMLTATEAMA